MGEKGGQVTVGRGEGVRCVLYIDWGEGEKKMGKKYFLFKKFTCLLGVRENNCLQASEVTFDLVLMTTPPSEFPSMGDHSGKFSPGGRMKEDTAGGITLSPPTPVGKMCGEGEGV